MNTSENCTIKTQNRFRKIIFDYGSLILFGFLLTGVVIASYNLSRLIPVDTFENLVSPLIHTAIFVVSVVGAILVYRHSYDIPARIAFARSLVWWAVLEFVFFTLEKGLGISVIVFGVQTINSLDMAVRNVFAILLLVYPMEVLYPKWLKWWRGVLMVLPAFLIWALNEWTEVDLRALMIVYPLIIAGILSAQIRVYRERCEDYYSSLENSAMKWIDIYLTILIVIGLSYFYLCFSSHPTRLFTQQWLILAILTYNILQIVCRKAPWRETNDVEGEVEPKEQDQHLQELKARLEAWMEKEKPYLNKDFCLVDLMEVLPMNRTYLSKFINTEYGCSFYQYVTDYRIREAKRLMEENPSMQLQEVADRSGFSSLTVFGRIFRRETGMTPTDWISR